MPLSVIITTFKKENVKRPLEGFGVLVPSKEQQNGLKTLGNAWLCPIQWNNLNHFANVLTIGMFCCTGTLFSSMMFPDRAPNDLYLYTTFVGGSRNMELARASTYEKLQCINTTVFRSATFYHTRAHFYTEIHKSTLNYSYYCCVLCTTDFFLLLFIF